MNTINIYEKLRSEIETTPLSDHRSGYLKALLDFQAEASKLKPCIFNVINKQTGEVFAIQKLIIESDGQISVWCNDWYGRHVIGQDCEFNAH